MQMRHENTIKENKRQGMQIRNENMIKGNKKEERACNKRKR